MSAPQYRFHMKFVARRKDNYYHTRWDLATPLSVVASTREKAFEKVFAMLGDAGYHNKWIADIESIEEVTADSAGGDV